ncbi:MAG: hypothetical protein ACE5GM_00295 [bacterium]
MKKAPLNLSDLKTYSLAERKSKVSVDDFASPFKAGGTFRAFLESFPHILASGDISKVAEAVVSAHKQGKPVIWGMGAHSIKCGLNPVIIDLMKRGVISLLALNGAGIVHDFELALIGRTSEDVAAELGSGSFGMARETGELVNQAVNCRDKEGLGESIGAFLVEQNPPYLEYSLFAEAYKREIPVTVHVAVGTDIVHLSPRADGACIGRKSLLDFQLFSAYVAELGGGGVYLNIGSAVILPEIFLKAVTLARNLGHPVTDFTTANFDFIQHYRPLQNVVTRPTAGGGKGYRLTGHHEIMIPLMAAMIVELLEG